MTAVSTPTAKHRCLGPVRATAAAIALTAASLSGCGSHITNGRTPAAASQSLASTVQAREVPTNTYRPIRYGTVVPETSLVSPRRFTDPTHGVALIGGETSPTGEGFAVTTNDRGHTWRIDSPVFYAPAADAPLGVSNIGATNAHTFFAWGRGGSVVDSTSDAGKHWWQAFLGSNIVAVTPKPNGDLIAVVQQTDNRPPGRITGVYISKNSGHTWQLTTQPAER